MLRKPKCVSVSSVPDRAGRGKRGRHGSAEPRAAVVHRSSSAASALPAHGCLKEDAFLSVQSTGYCKESSLLFPPSHALCLRNISAPLYGRSAEAPHRRVWIAVCNGREMAAVPRGGAAARPLGCCPHFHLSYAPSGAAERNGGAVWS